MKNGRLITVLTIFLMVISTCSLASAAPAITLRLGHGAAPGNPRHVVALEFAKYVNERTNGNVQVSVFPSETLGSDRQMTEAAAMGALDFCITAQGVMSTYNPKLAVIGLPFLSGKPEQVYRVLDGEIGEMLSEQVVPQGIRILAYWDNGFRQITNNVRPIFKPEDLKGLKIRTPEDKMTLAIFRALGANPAPLAFGELYLALSQGVFDGQENPLTNIYYSKLHEVQKYISLSNHKYECCPFIVSEKSWQKLPADIKKVLKEGGMKYATVHRQVNEAENERLLGEVKKLGVKVNVADVASMRAATKSVYMEFEPVFGKDLIDKVTAIAK